MENKENTNEEEKDFKVVALCTECKSCFTHWISDSNECPECEGKVFHFYPPETYQNLKRLGGIICQCGNPINIDRINNFWLQKMSSHNARLIERVEGMREKFTGASANHDIHKCGYNDALDDVLDILKVLKEESNLQE